MPRTGSVFNQCRRLCEKKFLPDDLAEVVPHVYTITMHEESWSLH